MAEPLFNVPAEKYDELEARDGHHKLGQAMAYCAMVRVQHFAGAGKELGSGWAVDAEGSTTTDPQKAVALLPFGEHKGYGSATIDEPYTAFIKGEAQEKRGSTFLFQCIHPEVLRGCDYARGRTQKENVKACVADNLGPGNERCLLPRELEAKAARLADQHGGLLFTKVGVECFAHLTNELGETAWKLEDL